MPANYMFNFAGRMQFLNNHLGKPKMLAEKNISLLIFISSSEVFVLVRGRQPEFKTLIQSFKNSTWFSSLTESHV